MPSGILSTLVFVGGQFATGMFDERDFCNELGPLEGNQIKAGPIGRFSYSQGKYDFWVAPDRVEFRCHELAVLPNAPIAAAQKVIDRLEPARPAISISAIGINCDSVFQTQEIGQEGNILCDSLTDTPLSQSLFEKPFISSVTFSFLSGAVRYGIRLEPEAQSQGKNLLVAINGHQDVTATDLLKEKMQAVEEVRNQVTGLYDRLSLLKGK